MAEIRIYKNLPSQVWENFFKQQSTKFCSMECPSINNRPYDLDFLDFGGNNSSLKKVFELKKGSKLLILSDDIVVGLTISYLELKEIIFLFNSIKVYFSSEEINFLSKENDIPSINLNIKNNICKNFVNIKYISVMEDVDFIPLSIRGDKKTYINFLSLITKKSVSDINNLFKSILINENFKIKYTKEHKCLLAEAQNN